MNIKLKSFIVLDLIVTSLLLTGCESLPGSREQQGAVAGGATGAVIGNVVSGGLFATLLGGAAGAGAGYLIGANYDKIVGDNSDDAQQAVEQARTQPATAADVDGADTADLNDDGFVTLDEVEAMGKAGLNDEEMLDRLRATNQVFELSTGQRDQLRNAGISQNVIAEMENINQEQRKEVLNRRAEVISRDPE